MTRASRARALRPPEASTASPNTASSELRSRASKPAGSLPGRHRAGHRAPVEPARGEAAAGHLAGQPGQDIRTPGLIDRGEERHPGRVAHRVAAVDVVDPDDQVDGVGLGEGGPQPGQPVRAGRAAGVGAGDARVAGLGEPGVAGDREVDARAPQHPHPAVARGPGRQLDAGLVGGAVVEEEVLVVGPELGDDRADDLVDVALLVAEAGQHRHRRAGQTGPGAAGRVGQDLHDARRRRRSASGWSARTSDPARRHRSRTSGSRSSSSARATAEESAGGHDPTRDAAPSARPPGCRRPRPAALPAPERLQRHQRVALAAEPGAVAAGEHRHRVEGGQVPPGLGHGAGEHDPVARPRAGRPGPRAGPAPPVRSAPPAATTTSRHGSAASSASASIAVSTPL